MAKHEPTTAHFINEVRSVTPTGGRALVTLESYGAPIRLSLDRPTLAKLLHWGRMAERELFDAPQCEIIPFARRA